MKWYLHKHHNMHLEDIKVQRGDEIETYYQYVIQIANTFPRDGVAIGALNLQDLIQAGHAGLIDAWDKVDHERPQAEKWAYLKKRIKWAIRREIDKYGAFIARPINKQEELRNTLSKAEKDLVNIFPSFFDNELINWEDSRPWSILKLAEIIDDYLYSNNDNTDHVEILRASFGIDRDKPISMKELAKKYRTTPGYINQIKRRMINKLKNDEEFTKIIKNFEEN